MVIDDRKIEGTNNNTANAKKEWERKEAIEPKSPHEPTRKQRLWPDNAQQDRDSKKESKDQCVKRKRRGLRIAREKLNLVGVAEPGAGVTEKEKGQRATKAYDGMAHKFQGAAGFNQSFVIYVLDGNEPKSSRVFRVRADKPMPPVLWRCAFSA